MSKTFYFLYSTRANDNSYLDIPIPELLKITLKLKNSMTAKK